MKLFQNLWLRVSVQRRMVDLTEEEWYGLIGRCIDDRMLDNVFRHQNWILSHRRFNCLPIEWRFFFSLVYGFVFENIIEEGISCAKGRSSNRMRNIVIVSTNRVYRMVVDGHSERFRFVVWYIKNDHKSLDGKTFCHSTQNQFRVLFLIISHRRLIFSGLKTSDSMD